MGRAPITTYRYPHGKAPLLGVEWESRWHAFRGSLGALFGPRVVLKPGRRFFQDSWAVVGRRKRALLASAMLHVGVIFFPYPSFTSAPIPQPVRRDSPDLELTWYQPARALPPLSPRKTSLRKAAEPVPDPPRAETFNPRQTILTTPLKPNHPRQTLIRPSAPPEPPKVLPPLPNIVQWPETQAPARPRLQISREALARLRPRRPRPTRPVEELPMPAVPNQMPQVGDLNIAPAAVTVEKPRFAVQPMSVPTAGPRRDLTDAAPAPEVGAAPVGIAGNGDTHRLVALSATPAPPPPTLEVPLGNLAARISAGPIVGAAPSAGNGGGTGPPDVFISRPDASPTSPVVGPPTATSPVSLPEGPSPRPSPASPAVRNPLKLASPTTSVRPTLEGYNPAAPPEAILGPKQVYRLHVNAPNLTSATGSWILSFTELDVNAYDAPFVKKNGELTGPSPLRKVDPKYPPALVDARVQGEVVLYAIIRKDGSVDSVQVLRSIEPELDHNAAEALSRWRFRPAERNGVPVDLEAVVVIPFRPSASFGIR